MSMNVSPKKDDTRYYRTCTQKIFPFQKINNIQLYKMLINLKLIKTGRYPSKIVVSNKVIVKPTNKSEQLIRNIELVHLKKCPGHKSCPAYQYECSDCHKKGQVRGTIVCKYSNKQHLTCHIETETYSTDTSDGESYSSDDSTDTESTAIQDENTLRQNVKLNKHITKTRHVRHKDVRKISKQTRYQVTIALKGNNMPAFADTGVDIFIYMLLNQMWKL